MVSYLRHEESFPLAMDASERPDPMRSRKMVKLKLKLSLVEIEGYDYQQ